ncbi:hypothetical protein MH117_09990 [Paenibacillus sp. ACRRX]|nr:hypothetical protein [Paenibacillus sp. ACRRX]
MLIGKGWEVTTYDDDYNLLNPNARIIDSCNIDPLVSRYSFVGDRDDIKLRTDPDLIEAIELLGDAANSIVAKLKVVEVPDGVEIEVQEYDGFEHIAEVHRIWQ